MDEAPDERAPTAGRRRKPGVHTAMSEAEKPSSTKPKAARGKSAISEAQLAFNRWKGSELRVLIKELRFWAARQEKLLSDLEEATATTGDMSRKLRELHYALKGETTGDYAAILKKAGISEREIIELTQQTFTLKARPALTPSQRRAVIGAVRRNMTDETSK